MEGISLIFRRNEGIKHLIKHNDNFTFIFSYYNTGITENN
jgi:hypothetical protein